MIGVISDNHPKFQQGDKRYEEVMALASEILARAHEGQKSSHPNMADDNVVAEFLRLEGELGLMEALRRLNASGDGEDRKYGNLILISSSTAPLEIRPFRSATDALRALFEIERDNPTADVVLVKADTSDEVRIAFKNYFTDPSEFIRLIEDGCHKLTGKRPLKGPVAIRRRKPPAQGNLF